MYSEAQLRHVRELLTQINTEALRGGLAIARGTAPTGSAALGKIAKLAEDAGRVLDGEVGPPPAPVPAGQQPLGEPPVFSKAMILRTIADYQPCELSDAARRSPALAELLAEGKVVPCRPDGRGFAGRIKYRLAGDRPVDDPRYRLGVH